MDEEQKQSYWETSGLAPAARWAAGLFKPQEGSLIDRGLGWARSRPIYGVTTYQQQRAAAYSGEEQRRFSVG